MRAVRSPNASTNGCGRRTARGAVLLEVVLATGILFVGMSVIGLQVVNGLQVARNVESTLEATLLVDTLLAEMDAGAVVPESSDDLIEGDFGIRAPGYAWRILIEPADVDDLLMLTFQISYNDADADDQVNNPDRQIDFDPDRLLREVHRLYPVPADVNMERDFGVTSEDLQPAFGLGPGGDSGEDQEGGGSSPFGDLSRLASELGVDLTSFDFLFDPGGFDPRMLAHQLPEEEFMALMGLMETLLRQGGGALTELGGGRSDRRRDESAGAEGSPGGNEGNDGGMREDGARGGRRPPRGTGRRQR